MQKKKQTYFSTRIPIKYLILMQNKDRFNLGTICEEL